MRLLRFKNEQDSTGELFDVSRPIVLHKGDIVAFEIENMSTSSAYVTVLFVDSAYGIQPMFPDKSVLDGLIAPRTKSKKSKLVVAKSQVTAETTGWEHIIVVGVDTTNGPQDFSFLSQTSIPKVRGEQENDALGSPLGQLLRHLNYRDTETSRGLITCNELAHFGFATISWQVEPSGRAAKKLEK